MTNLNIDRLTLKLSTSSEWEGQRLARLIAQELGTVSIDIASPRHQEAIQVNLTTRPGDSVDWLAKQIVTEVLRQLQ